MQMDEQVAAAVGADVPYRYLREGLLPLTLGHPQSSSANRVTAGALGFFAFTQCGERPD